MKSFLQYRRFNKYSRRLMDHLRYFPQQKIVMIKFLLFFQDFSIFDAYKQMHTSRFILGSRSNSRCLCWVPCWSVCIAVCALLQFSSFLGLLRQIYSVVIKRILNSCIQISHHNFEYLLHTQFQDSFSLIFFKKCLGVVRC